MVFGGLITGAMNRAVRLGSIGGTCGVKVGYFDNPSWPMTVDGPGADGLNTAIRLGGIGSVCGVNVR